MADGKDTSETDAEIAAATRGFRLNRTMLHVRDPERSMGFYAHVLGFRLIHKYDVPALKYSIYVLAHEDRQSPASVGERQTWLFGRTGLLALRHNWDSGTEEDGRAENGPAQPFGHIAITVPDVHVACERFQRLGVPMIKRPDEGVIRGVALVKDPDGYVIEVVSAHSLADAIKA